MTNTVTTQQAQQSAMTWFKALTKQFSVRVGVEETRVGIFMDKNFGTAGMSGDAMRKLENMFGHMRKGFDNSKEWTRATDAKTPFYMDKYISADGRFKVIMRKQYCGSGGYKVATMYFSFTMIDLQAEVPKAVTIG